MVELARFDARREADEAAFLLDSVGIRTSVERRLIVNGRRTIVYILRVEDSQQERAARILAEERAEPRSPAAPSAARPRLYWVVGLAVINLCVWLAMEGRGGSESHQTLLRFGASHGPSVAAGQWWRTVTAIFLHIGALHLLGNLATLTVLGPFVLEQQGVARFFAIYLLAGVGGNWLSFLLGSATSIKAGASGAILGLLGALAGQRIKQTRGGGGSSRFKSWHVLAMLVAFYGFVVGTGRADHLAHVGGIVVGVLMALLLPVRGRWPAQRERRLETVLGALVLVTVATAAAAAVLRAGS